MDYAYDNTYSFPASYFNVTGSNDALAYPNSITGSPNSNGFIFDVAYMPFSHGSGSLLPLVQC
ncbi:MAG TPA: hypothetical protein VKA03_00785 [Methylovirgula sp.]|nr:hypothetical protein [Methylovirgula sp.]